MSNFVIYIVQSIHFAAYPVFLRIILLLYFAELLPADSQSISPPDYAIVTVSLSCFSVYNMHHFTVGGEGAEGGQDAEDEQDAEGRQGAEYFEDDQF